MRRKGRLLQSSILTAALFAFAAPAFAETAPGDSCSNLNYIVATGGPETSGVRNILRCDGANWQKYMTIDANGRVGFMMADMPQAFLQVGDVSASGGFHSVAIGEADDNDSNLYGTGFVGFNLTGGDNAYSTGSNTANNGGAAIVGSLWGRLYFVNVTDTGGSAQNLTAADLEDNITMTVSEDHNVGIRTESPQAFLQVGPLSASGDHHAVSLGEMLNDASTIYGTGYVGFNLTGNENSFKSGSDTANNGASAVVGDIFGGLRFVTLPSTGGSEQNLTAADLLSDAKMSIDADGKVGIGTTSPPTNLHVYSEDAYGTALSVATDGAGAGSQAVLDLMTKGNGSDKLGDSTSAGWQIWANGDSSTNYASLGGANTFGIGFANGAGWMPAALQILDNGNVGIGTALTTSVPGTTLDVGGSFGLSNDITPAQITANQNNYNPTDIDKASVLRLSSDASRTITGIVGGVDGRVLTILNVGANPIVLANQNASSDADDRFALGADITIGADQSASLIYDATSQRWRSAALPFESSGLAGPAGCANIGDLCADGTVFAGWNPITQDQLLIPTTDQGTTSDWKTSTGTDDIATDSIYDGRANTDQVANSATFPAFKLCKDLTTAGHSDWYLPSRVELYYIWSVRGTINAAGNITDFLNTSYWSSTEHTTTRAWVVSFANGTQDNLSKASALRVRCVRR